MPFGLDISFSVGSGTPDKEIPRRISVAFERAGANLTHFARYVWPGVTKAMEKSAKEQFEAEGDGPVAGHWAPLSPRYAEWKAKHYPGAPILVREGNLKAAFTNSDSPFAARAESDAEMVWGTQGLEYASTKQFGGPHEPARPPVDFGEDFEDAMRRAAARGVRQALLDGELTKYATVMGDDE